jgi:mannose-1-phosphate guanylyltransferase
MKNDQRYSRLQRWAVIPAGGDGTRLLPVMRKIAGDDRPTGNETNKGTAPAMVHALSIPGEMHSDGLVAPQPEKAVLPGIPPETPEAEYGWIEPGIGPGNCGRSRFREKPHRSLAADLMKLASLWSSFVMVGQVYAFLNLNRRTLPGPANAFESIRPSLSTGLGHSTSFSQDATLASRAESRLCSNVKEAQRNVERELMSRIAVG